MPDQFTSIQRHLGVMCCKIGFERGHEGEEINIWNVPPLIWILDAGIKVPTAGESIKVETQPIIPPSKAPTNTAYKF